MFNYFKVCKVWDVKIILWELHSNMKMVSKIWEFLELSPSFSSVMPSTAIRTNRLKTIVFEPSMHLSLCHSSHSDFKTWTPKDPFCQLTLGDNFIIYLIYLILIGFFLKITPDSLHFWNTNVSKILYIQLQQNFDLLISMNKNDNHGSKHKRINFTNSINSENLIKETIIAKGCMGKFLKLSLCFLLLEKWGKANRDVYELQVAPWERAAHLTRMVQLLVI